MNKNQRKGRIFKVQGLNCIYLKIGSDKETMIEDYIELIG